MIINLLHNLPPGNPIGQERGGGAELCEELYYGDGDSDAQGGQNPADDLVRRQIQCRVAAEAVQGTCCILFFEICSKSASTNMQQLVSSPCSFYGQNGN